MMARTRLVCIACSAYRPELEHLAAAGRLRAEMRYLDSGLHMRPGQLSAAIQAAIEEARATSGRVVLLFGDCAGQMPGDLPDGVRSVACENCSQALLGAEGYQRSIRERACCLFHEWALRWREVLANIPGLGPELSAELLRESHHKLVYLDTGVAPPPVAELEDCAAHFQMSLEVLPVPLTHFEELLAASGLLEGEQP